MSCLTSGSKYAHVDVSVVFGNGGEGDYHRGKLRILVEVTSAPATVGRRSCKESK